MSGRKSFKLYVGCLPSNATVENLTELLSTFGQIKDVQLVLKKGKCVGSGNAEMADEEGYNNILKSEIFFEERRLEVSPFLENNNLKEMQLDMNLRKIAVRGLF